MSARRPARPAPLKRLIDIVASTGGRVVLSPILFVLSTLGGLALKSDWRFAGPLWLFSAASGLFLVTVFMASSLSLADQRQVWTVASVLLLASAAWATVEGYRSR